MSIDPKEQPDEVVSPTISIPGSNTKIIVKPKIMPLPGRKVWLKPEDFKPK